MTEPTTDRLTLGASVLVTLIVAVLHYAVFELIYRYVDVYDEFGGELPWLTELMVESPVYWVFPVLVAVCMVIHQAGHISRRLALLFSTLGSALNTAMCVIALYLPIIRLGSLVTE